MTSTTDDCGHDNVMPLGNHLWWCADCDSDLAENDAGLRVLGELDDDEDDDA